jgi:hypothetical protein
MASAASDEARDLDLDRWAAITPLVVHGHVEAGAQLVDPERAEGPDGSQVDVGKRVLERLAEKGVHLVYAVPTARWSEDVLRALGFVTSFDVVLRNFYLGLDDDGLKSVRRVATLARRIRQKLIEVDFDDTWIAYAARLFDLKRSDISLGVDRSEEYLRSRYRRGDREYRLLVLRRQAGVGIDGYAVVRLLEHEPGRTLIQLVDHFTKIGERRSTTWLLGEIALWGLAERASVVQAFAADGSVLEHVLIGAGCIRKPLTLPFMVRSLFPNEEGLKLPVDGVQLRASDLAIF